MIVLLAVPGVAHAGTPVALAPSSPCLSGEAVVAPSPSAPGTPSYCDAFDVVYTDTCDQVTITVTNNYASDVVIGIYETSDNTPDPLGSLSILQGAKKSFDVIVGPTIHKISLYLDNVSEYIDTYTPKGVGNCASASPSPSESSSASPDDRLPQTGSNLTVLIVVGLVLVTGGAAALITFRNRRRSV